MKDNRFKRAPQSDGIWNLAKDEGGEGADDESGAGKDEPYLGSWSTKEDAVEGLKNLQGKLSEQGNETGNLRKQVEEGQTMISEMQAQMQQNATMKQEQTTNQEAEVFRGEQAKISKQIADLDPVDEGYSGKLMSLINKSNELAAKGQHEKTLTAATDAFRAELDERDIRSAHQSFDTDNPDFRTPEMQARIKERVAQDSTGMSDSLSAFREIQRDDAMVRADELTKENEGLMERLNLKKGTDETGTVIVKSQTSQEGKTQPKTSGAARNQGMQEALNKTRE